MTFDVRSWLRAVWTSLIEPADMADRILQMEFGRNPLWMMLALVTVLNVLLLSLMQALSPTPLVLQGQVITLTPFSYTVFAGGFVVIWINAIHLIGRAFGGQGSFVATLKIMVWVQAMNLTLELGQFFLFFLSPYMAAIFGLIGLGAMIRCIVHFVSVLHGFESLGKSLVTLALSLIPAALGGGILLIMMGAGPVGGTT